MKLLNYFSVFILLFSVSGCAVWKKSLNSAGSIDAAIDNAITDFVHTSRLFRADEVFHITCEDHADQFIVYISGAVNKVYPYPRDTVGSRVEVFPTRYAVRQGKLFYWNDPDYPITQEVLDILDQYRHIEFGWMDIDSILSVCPEGKIDVTRIFPPVAIDDGKRGRMYYLCKDNPSRYKKTGSNTIYKHYKVPKLNCRR